MFYSKGIVLKFVLRKEINSEITPICPVLLSSLFMFIIIIIIIIIMDPHWKLQILCKVTLTK